MRSRSAKRSRRWYRRNIERARSLARGYAHRDREIRNEKDRARRRAIRASNPNHSRESTAAFRAKNPNYTREYYARMKLRAAWLKFTRTCAANRRARAMQESECASST
jgi:hypothetical protein